MILTTQNFPFHILADTVDHRKVGRTHIILFQCIVQSFGCGLTFTCLFQKTECQFLLIQHQTLDAGDGLFRGKAGCMDVLLTFKIHGMPGVVGDKSQAQGRNEEVVQLVALVAGAMTKVRVVSVFPGVVGQLRHHQGRGGSVGIMHGIQGSVRQLQDGLAEDQQPFGRWGGQKAMVLFAGGCTAPGRHGAGGQTRRELPELL